MSGRKTSKEQRVMEEEGRRSGRKGPNLRRRRIIRNERGKKEEKRNID